MYCGSCLRDNALAAELIARGHDVTLLPIYTPTLTDEPNVSNGKVFFGGISVYLEQYVPLFRKSPRWLDRLWDSKPMLQFASRRSISTSPKMLGEMTVSMLKGEDGFQQKEVAKLLEWAKHEAPPDLVSLPYSLLLGLAKPIKEALGRPVCCTLQGEDLFLEGLQEPYRSEAMSFDSRTHQTRRCVHLCQRLLRRVHAGLSKVPRKRFASCRSESICMAMKAGRWSAPDHLQ